MSKTLEEHLVRTCFVCREKGNRWDLLRFVKDPAVEGLGVRFDRSSKAPGRGIYLHKTRNCVISGHDPKKWARVLRISGSISRERIERLLDCVLKEIIDDKD